MEPNSNLLQLPKRRRPQSKNKSHLKDKQPSLHKYQLWKKLIKSLRIKCLHTLNVAVQESLSSFQMLNALKRLIRATKKFLRKSRDLNATQCSTWRLMKVSEAFNNITQLKCSSLQLFTALKNLLQTSKQLLLPNGTATKHNK